MRDKILIYILKFILISQIFSIGYLSVYFYSNDRVENYSEIIISGNILLDEDYYRNILDYSHFGNSISLNSIKTELEKHPYIAFANVKLNSQNKLIVYIQEKKINSIIVKNSLHHFITNNFEIISIENNTNIPHLPLIIYDDDISNNQPKNQNTIIAFKIIDLLNQINSELNKALSVINLSNENKLILTIRGILAPIIMTKTNLVEELLKLNEILQLENSIYSNQNIRYIDLRFNQQVIIG